MEETYINRSTEFKPLSFTLTFENSDVELPTIRSANDNAARNYEGIKELERNAKGKWKVIGEKEDSVSYIEKNKWKYFDLFNPSCEEKVCTSIDADNNNVVTIGYDCGIHVTYMFKHINGTWTLYKIDDGSM